MSRREGRDSDSKRHRSKFDREPSPKRSRRDGKPATERPSSNLNLDIGNHSGRDQKHRRRLQDALPLEVPRASDPKVETGGGSKEFDKRTNEQREGNKNSSNATEVPQSQSFFQHDERGNARQVGRTTGRGAVSDRRWRDSKDQHNERAVEKTTTRDKEQRDEKSQARGADNRVWRHDGFYEIEADQAPPARKRPSFREKKVEVDSENTDKAPAQPVKPTHPEPTLVGGERRVDRGGHNPRFSDRPGKPFLGDREANKGEAHRGSFSSRDRYGGNSNYRDRERFNGTRGYHLGGGVRVEKWKHDLFEEGNRSPTPKKEEDQIAKVEALLAS
ncbi:DEAD-box ATP-dependent RNA helicase [Actinidia chinensis var. chinensis]|uniref:DEAD-box ATP-dependent RNA helicase n=1 Tax=Actinidia chinensis var. chinensis TaxID=1590841 RepID=A0A2R6RC70_ACTCC|nr:DEAD-box ATP-dependent RNA helicase [Actinidia chinensis var. chinensis]